MRSTENLDWEAHASSMKFADESPATAEQGHDQMRLHATILLHQAPAIG
jgi:hypothetical protein